MKYIPQVLRDKLDGAGYSGHENRQKMNVNQGFVCIYLWKHTGINIP